MSREDPQLKIRLPDELKTAVEQAAVAAGRSMNAEIVARLQDHHMLVDSAAGLASELQQTKERLAAAEAEKNGMEKHVESLDRMFKVHEEELSLLRLKYDASQRELEVLQERLDHMTEQSYSNRQERDEARRKLLVLEDQPRLKDLEEKLSDRANRRIKEMFDEDMLFMAEAIARLVEEGVDAQDESERLRSAQEDLERLRLAFDGQQRLLRITGFYVRELAALVPAGRASQQLMQLVGDLGQSLQESDYRSAVEAASNMVQFGIEGEYLSPDELARRLPAQKK